MRLTNVLRTRCLRCVPYEPNGVMCICEPDGVEIGQIPTGDDESLHGILVFLEPIRSVWPQASFGLADILIALTGLWMGSLVYAIASRISVRGEVTSGQNFGWVLGNQPSHPNQPIQVWEFIPLIGIIMQRAFARGCQHKHCCRKLVLARLTLELATAAAFLALYQHYGLGLHGVLHMIIALHLCLLAGTDIMYRLLPNKVLLSVLGFALVLRSSALSQPRLWTNRTWLIRAQGMSSSLSGGILGACFGFGFLLVAALIKPGAIGGGDVKMAGVIGFYLGFPGVVSGLAVGFTLAAVYTVILLLLGRLKTTDTIPLGVFLSISTIWAVVARG